MKSYIEKINLEWHDSDKETPIDVDNGSSDIVIITHKVNDKIGTGIGWYSYRDKEWRYYSNHEVLYWAYLPAPFLGPKLIKVMDH